MLNEMTAAAKALTKNPLGVIGLFIVLVYGLACMVLTVSGSSLDREDKEPLVWFIVLFPVLILGAFFRLVTAHHKKLYAPADYKDEKNFLSSIIPLSEEKKSLRDEGEIERIEKIEKEINGGKAEIRSEATIRTSYSEAEKLGFLAIEDELKKPVQKYVEIDSNGRKEAIDGILISEKIVHLVEIKYFSRPAFKREFFEAIIHRSSGFIWGQLLDQKIVNATIWFVIVVDFERAAMPKFEEAVKSQVVSDLCTIKICLHHIDDLRGKYGKLIN